MNPYTPRAVRPLLLGTRKGQGSELPVFNGEACSLERLGPETGRVPLAQG